MLDPELLSPGIYDPEELPEFQPEQAWPGGKDRKAEPYDIYGVKIDYSNGTDLRMRNGLEKLLTNGEDTDPDIKTYDSLRDEVLMASRTRQRGVDAFYNIGEAEHVRTSGLEAIAQTLEIEKQKYQITRLKMFAKFISDHAGLWLVTEAFRLPEPAIPRQRSLPVRFKAARLMGIVILQEKHNNPKVIPAVMGMDEKLAKISTASYVKNNSIMSHAKIL